MSRDRELFTLVERDGAIGIRCGMCTFVSFNPNDIEQKYCGRCHTFLLEDLRVPV